MPKWFKTLFIWAACIVITFLVIQAVISDPIGAADKVKSFFSSLSSVGTFLKNL